jgi:protein-tyrosine phosphatase
MIQVIFVCLGNICRSPLAEAIFKDLVEKNGLSYQISCDSAGTSGYHDGERADPYSIKVGKNHGLDVSHISRKFILSDFTRFHYILVMDENNLRDVRNLEKSLTSKGNYTIELMRAFDNQKSRKKVDDPWSEGIESFERCYDILKESCENFLNFLIEKHNLKSGK